MIISHSAAETVQAGFDCGKRAVARDVFGLIGELGAGKTQFVKGFAAGIGSAADVTSPTFTLIHEYLDGRLPLYHFDFYRIGSAPELVRVGFDDYVEGDGVCIIEWADRFPDLIPARSTWIGIASKSENVRAIDWR